MTDDNTKPLQEPVGSTVTQGDALSAGVSILRPSGRMTSDGGMARRQPVVGNSDPHAAALQQIEDLQKRVAQVAEAAGQGDGVLFASIELLRNSVSALQTTVSSLVEHLDAVHKNQAGVNQDIGYLKAALARLPLEAVVEGLSNRVTALEKRSNG